MQKNELRRDPGASPVVQGRTLDDTADVQLALHAKGKKRATPTAAAACATAS
jgi:hypothetical protein